MSDPYLTDAFIKDLHGKIAKLEAGQAENADAIRSLRTETRGLIELFQSLEGGFKVLQGLGRLAKPLAYIVGLVSAVITAYSAWRGIGK